MKTICTWDNVACMVDNLDASPMAFPAVVFICAVATAWLFASVWKG